MNTQQTRKGFTFYRSYAEAIELLPVSMQLLAYKSVIAFALDAKEPDEELLPQRLRMLWKIILPNLEADRRRFSNGCKGGAPKGNQNARKDNQETTENQPPNNQESSNVNEDVNVNENVNVKRGGEEASPRAQKLRFVPPTIDEICDYIKECGYDDIDAQSFADYYASVGWKVGGKPMCDWRAALRRWHSHNKHNTNNLKYQKNESKTTSPIAANAPRLFCGLSDDDYLADARPSLSTPSANHSSNSRRTAH